MESSRNKGTEQRCFDLLSEVQREIKKEADDRIFRLESRLRAEKAQETESLQQILAEKETLLPDHQRAESEVSCLNQELEARNMVTQDQVAWNEIQPVFYEAHG